MGEYRSARGNRKRTIMSRRKTPNPCRAARPPVKTPRSERASPFRPSQLINWLGYTHSVGIRETFSKRQKRLAKAGQQDVYQYDDLPKPFRVQVVYILVAAIGPSRASHHGYETPSAKIWESLHKDLRKEFGVFTLTGKTNSAQEDFVSFVLEAAPEQAFDAIEFAFQDIDDVVRRRYQGLISTELKPSEAIEELNQRFKEHGIGYQFIQHVLVASRFLNSSMLKLLSPPYRSSTHRDLMVQPRGIHQSLHTSRHGRDKEAVVDALKAFESTMKAICVARKWAVDPTATAKDLIKTLLTNGLIPPELESHFTGLQLAM